MGMKREEAIRIATGLRTDFKCESETMVDFCNTIIKALKQKEPCEDCVSRADLKKWLDMNFSFGGATKKLELFDRLDKELPPVTLPNSKMELVEDCISRQAALDVIEREQFKGDAISEIEKLPPVTPQPMKEKWQELKETIIEMRDNDGTSTQQETCKFLANLMDVLEKQMEEKENEKEI